MAKSEAEKAAEAEEKRKADEKEAEELKAESERVAKEKAEKDEARRKSREAAEDTKGSEKMYSESQVRALIRQEMAKLKSGESDTDLEEGDINKQKKIRIPRFQGKFIYSFKNTNTDEYFPELVVHAFDVWNDQSKRNDAWVTAVFEDGSELNVPLYTVLTKSQKVWVDLVEVVAADTSYSAGRTERAEVKDYSRQGTGVYVKMKVTRADYSYKVRFANGDEKIISKEVVNW